MKTRLHPASNGFLITNQCPVIADVHRARGPDHEYVTFMEVENTEKSIRIDKKDWAEFQSMIAEIAREWTP